jgi:hypothetical protein
MEFINVEKHLKLVNSIEDKDKQILKLKEIISKLQNELNIVHYESTDWCVAWEEIFDVIHNNNYLFAIERFGLPISFEKYKKYQVESHCFTLTPEYDYGNLSVFRVENDKIICIGEDSTISLTDDQLVQTYFMRRVKLD